MTGATPSVRGLKFFLPELSRERTMRDSVAVIWALRTILGTATAFGQPLPTCAINMDNGCPDISVQCGATFQGGGGCTPMLLT